MDVEEKVNIYNFASNGFTFLSLVTFSLFNECASLVAVYLVYVCDVGNCSDWMQGYGQCFSFFVCLQTQLGPLFAFGIHCGQWKANARAMEGERRERTKRIGTSCSFRERAATVTTLATMFVLVPVCCR